MEVADALYGVSMRGDGITTVISPAPARAAEPAASMTALWCAATRRADRRGLDAPLGAAARRA